jgi:hypothetical protein
MQAGLRDKLNTEVTRKQFLQYTGALLLMVFGLDNLIALLTAGRGGKLLPQQHNAASDGFGARKFGE